MVLLVIVTSAPPKICGSENTACRITAHRGAFDRRVRASVVGSVTNTAVVVVADITIDDRQAGGPGKSETEIDDPVGVVADNAVSDCHAGTTTAFVHPRNGILGACSGVVADDAGGDRHGSPDRTLSGIVVEPGGRVAA